MTTNPFSLFFFLLSALLADPCAVSVSLYSADIYRHNIFYFFKDMHAAPLTSKSVTKTKSNLSTLPFEPFLDPRSIPDDRGRNFVSLVTSVLSAEEEEECHWSRGFAIASPHNQVLR
jgi:hypothetical protein